MTSLAACKRGVAEVEGEVLAVADEGADGGERAACARERYRVSA